MEHRRFRRLPTHTPAILRSSDGEEFAPCWITEVSREGVGIACEGERLPHGGFVEVILPCAERPERDWPRTWAQVIHGREGRLGIWLGDAALEGDNPVAKALMDVTEESP